MPATRKALAVLRPLGDLLWVLESVTFSALAALLLAAPLAGLALIRRLSHSRRPGTPPFRRL